MGDKEKKRKDIDDFPDTAGTLFFYVFQVPFLDSSAVNGHVGIIQDTKVPPPQKKNKKEKKKKFVEADRGRYVEGRRREQPRSSSLREPRGVLPGKDPRLSR